MLVASCQAPSTSGLSASPAATAPRRSIRPRSVARLAITRYSVGAMHSRSTALALEQLQPLVGIEARVVQQRRRAAQPRRDEHVAGRLGPAGRGRAPHEVAGAGVEPVARLQHLAGQVALAVEHGLRLAGGARGERDQARVAGLEVRRAAGPARRRSSPHGAHSVGPSQPAAREHVGVALVADHVAAARRGEPQLEVLRAQLLVAGERRRGPAGSRRPSSAPTRAGCRRA